MENLQNQINVTVSNDANVKMREQLEREMLTIQRMKLERMKRELVTESNKDIPVIDTNMVYRGLRFKPFLDKDTNTYVMYKECVNSIKPTALVYLSESGKLGERGLTRGLGVYYFLPLSDAQSIQDGQLFHQDAKIIYRETFDIPDGKTEANCVMVWDSVERKLVPDMSKGAKYYRVYSVTIDALATNIEIAARAKKSVKAESIEDDITGSIPF